MQDLKHGLFFSFSFFFFFFLFFFFFIFFFYIYIIVDQTIYLKMESLKGSIMQKHSLTIIVMIFFYRSSKVLCENCPKNFELIPIISSRQNYICNFKFLIPYILQLPKNHLLLNNKRKRI